MLDDGSARITEHDGDQFIVKPSGNIKPLTKAAKMGAKDGLAASDVYAKDDGIEQAFYGRGYVQLTWWSNYAQAGIALGHGLDLMLNPELVKTPEMAFELMSYGMRTGKIFANGNMLDDFISGTDADYEGARAMVNGTDHAAAIAEIARKIEAVLQKSRSDREMSRPMPTRIP
ncbi:glycoside hydrolase family 19 protein [Aquabacterium sp.]|uniref:glycoside hydrolase family 19 protein n=1 Tax=Aquabacterium sp. TaxID=1872578 RepID=UPI0025C44010|nr:glycoside hydrolase family 19 protein [Aquabacterium sp.]